MANKKMIYGLDIGISSVGWAVIRLGDILRIEDCGVRIFDSGEQTKMSPRKSQERRGCRSQRRLVRRRRHRKERLKFYLQKCGLISIEAIQAYYENNQNNPLVLREKGLNKRLCPEEIAACLIHISNYRGYKEFYDLETEDLDDETASEKKGLDELKKLMEQGGYQTAAQLFLHDPHFTNGNSSFPNYHNHYYKQQVFSIPRNCIQEETERILKCQSAWYPCLTDSVIRHIIEIIFSQRDFEDGPGDSRDENRLYTGYTSSVGRCMYYSEEKRGARFTVLADLYALVNVLSQSVYVRTDTGEIDFRKEAAAEILESALQKGSMDDKTVTVILKKHHLKRLKNKQKKDSKATTAGSCRFMKQIKETMESAGFDWPTLVGSLADILDRQETLLTQISRVLSDYQTPRRRVKELRKISGVDDQLASKLARKKMSGTANVSERYMAEAIRAFCNGETYGNFQQRKLKEQASLSLSSSSLQSCKLPPFSKDEEFYRNPVVLRSLNETRKIINALVGKYGSPYAINIEVAKEVGRSYEEQSRMEKEQNKNHKERESVKKQIADILNISESDVRPVAVERFMLGEQQGWKCLYSGKPIDQVEALRAADKQYEIDHIVPFSLILDDSRQNKALVLSSENQLKKQQTPLMYMAGKKQEEFISRVTDLYKKGIISKKKYDYLMLADLYSAQAVELLDEWKSRNLNDTRYVTKFLVGYLRKNLLFDRSASDGDPVFAVNGAITSRFRREWLNKATWGREAKAREETHLHHVADAIVIANCTRRQVELASDNMKLYRMLRNNRWQETEEYKSYLKNAIHKMQKYYHMDPKEAESRLRFKGNTVSLLPNIRDEVDIRLMYPEENDPSAVRETERLFRAKVREFYTNDPKFADSLQMVMVSYKQDRKLAGPVAASNPISVRDGYQYMRKLVLELKKEDLGKLCGNDGDLKESLDVLFEGAGEKTKAGDILKAQGKDTFITQKGRIIRKVTLRNPQPKGVLVKESADSNKTVLNNESYVCLEIYRNNKGEVGLRGIPYSAVYRSKKGVEIRDTKPDDYDEHLLYLRKYDYFEFDDKNGNLKFSGTFINSYNVNQRQIRVAHGAKLSQQKKPITISKTDQNFRKRSIDILGKFGGEIQCGEPLL